MRYFTRLATVSASTIAAVYRITAQGTWEVWHPVAKQWIVCDPDLAYNRQRDLALGDLLMTEVPEAVGVTWAARLSAGA